MAKVLRSFEHWSLELIWDLVVGMADCLKDAGSLSRFGSNSEFNNAREGDEMKRDHSSGSKKNLTEKMLPFLLVIWILLFFITPLHATTGSLQSATTQGLGVEFSVAVVVDSVANLYGLATDLTYDPEYLEVVDQDATPGNGIQPKLIEGTFLNNNGADPTLLLSALQDETPGTLILGITRSGNVSGVSTATNKTILSVRFNSKKVGTTSIQFNKAGLKDASYGTISVAAWNGVTINISDLVPAISVSCPSTDFGSIVIGNSSNRSCTVSNTGTADLEITSINITGTDAAMFSQTNTCSTVSPGNSCEISLTFTPTSVGAKTANLGISSNDPNTPSVDVSLTGTGLGIPNIAVSPSPLDFGSVIVGSSLMKPLTVSNDGTSPLVISSITISGVDAGMFTQTNDCTTVAPAGSCTIQVTFTPGSEGGKTGTATINSNDPDAPALNVILTGTGLVPDIAVDPLSLAFGVVPVGSPSTKSLTVSNTGGAPLLVGPITISGTDAGMFTQTNDCTTVAPAGSCTIQVTFTPTSAGAKAATLAISSNDPDPGENPFSVPLNGNGASPNIAVSSVLLSENFSGGIPASWPMAGAWNEGSGGSPCPGSPAIGPPFVAPWAILDSSCYTTFYEELYTPVLDAAPCNSLTLSFSNQYRHDPLSSAGVAVSDDGGLTWPADVLTMNADDGYPTPNTKEIDISSAAGSEGAQIRFAYYGEGNFWAIDNVQVFCHQPDEVKFVSPLGQSVSRSLLISNTGESDLHVGTLGLSGAHAGDFAILIDGCSSQTIPVSGKCSAEILFAPSDDGARTASLSIPSDDSDTPALNLPLQGTGIFFSVSPDKGTIGTIVEIVGSGFGATKGKVTIRNDSVTMTTKVLQWTDGWIQVSLSKFLPTGTTYDITVIPKVPKGTLPIVQPDAFEFRPPEIVWLSDDHGTVGDLIVLRGWHFGTKKGKVYIGTKSCKVVRWAMDPETNYGEIVFTVPKGPLPGPYDLKVVNKVGTATTEFTIE